ncbi:unnamed protein product [Mucor hiemalis]
MLLSNDEHEKLLDCPWLKRSWEGKDYYYKYNIDIPDEYLLLITDMTIVWFEHGNHERMKESAETELKMELSDREASSSLLKRIKPVLKRKYTVVNSNVYPAISRFVYLWKTKQVKGK